MSMPWKSNLTFRFFFFFPCLGLRALFRFSPSLSLLVGNLDPHLLHMVHDVVKPAVVEFYPRVVQVPELVHGFESDVGLHSQYLLPALL
jgi:hypothetical protein